MGAYFGLHNAWSLPLLKPIVKVVFNPIHYFFDEVENARLNELRNSDAAALGLFDFPAASIKAEPMITPSAIWLTCTASSGVDMPNPTAKGRSVSFLTLVINSLRLIGKFFRAPVTPLTETK